MQENSKKYNVITTLPNIQKKAEYASVRIYFVMSSKGANIFIDEYTRGMQ